MDRKDRLEIVRRMVEDNPGISMTEVAKASHVSVRTTYRDLHQLLTPPTTVYQQSLNVRAPW